MNEQEFHLSQMVTNWDLIRQAQQTGSEAALARADLLVRYHRGVYRYLVSRLGDPHAADKLLSDFALRILNRDPFLERAQEKPGPSPGDSPTPAAASEGAAEDGNRRGRFRFYLMAVLRRMVVQHYREQARGRARQQPLRTDWEPAAPEPTSTRSSDRALFVECWRRELLDQALRALAQEERQTGRPYYTLLRLKEDHPELRAAQLAEQLGAARQQTFKDFHIRTLLHRGRKRYAELLVEETVRTLRSAPAEPVPPEMLEQELIELKLLNYFVREALVRYTEQFHSPDSTDSAPGHQ